MSKSFALLTIAATAIFAAGPSLSQSNGGMAGSPMAPQGNRGDMSGSTMPNGQMSNGAMSDDSMGGMASKGSMASKPMAKKKTHHKKMMHKAPTPASDTTPTR